MPTKKLTEVVVANTRAPVSGRLELWDAMLPGFGLRITDKDARSWVVMYRAGGRKRRLTLGTYPALSLAAAREQARQALREAAAGRDPAGEKAEARQRQPDTVASVFAEFMERYDKPNNRAWAQRQRAFDSDILPVWGKLDIASITRRDVIELVDRIVDRGSPVMARLDLAFLSRFFKWAVERGIIEASPVVNIPAPPKVTSRDRVLTDDEIRILWPTLDAAGWPYGPITKLLLVTAQRRLEVAGMRWADVDTARALWVIPRELAKSDRANEVPLSPLAMEILAELPRLSEVYVFPARADHGGPVAGFSEAKKRLDRLSGLSGWRLHDLRRTAASGMARLGVAPHVVEKVLNHAGKAISGVAAIYNRHGYLDEKRHALEAWARHVETLIGRTPASNVVELAAAR